MFLFCNTPQMDMHEMGAVSVGHTGERSKSHSFQSRVRLPGGMSHNHNCEVACFFLPALQTSVEGLYVRLRKLLDVRCVCEMRSTHVCVSYVCETFVYVW